MRTNEDLHQNQSACSEHSSNGSPCRTDLEGNSSAEVLPWSSRLLQALALLARQTCGGATAAKGTAKVDSVDGNLLPVREGLPVLTTTKLDDSLVTNQLKFCFVFAG